MLENSKTQTMIEELCRKLHCSDLAADLERVNRARELLAQLQQSNILRKLHSNSKHKNMFSSTLPKFSDLLLKTKQRLNKVPLDLSSSKGIESEDSMNLLEDAEFPKEEYELENSTECDDLSADAWLGYFHGYDILKENQTSTLSENKQCIELSLKDDCSALEGYLRAGVRCFMIDLFLGTDLEKQKLIFHLRESELKISKEYGFPFNTTLCALLSPRLQYTGVMAAGSEIAKLEKGNNIIITTKRKYSTSGSSLKIYINARFLLEDCKTGDFILVGHSIQLLVADVQADKLNCVIVEPGLLSSRLPVRFPAHCRRSEISLEELEDMTFAREVGINVLVSYEPGSLAYLKVLNATFDLLKYDNLKLFTRLVLNSYEEQDIEDIEWIAKSYQGFLVELNFQQYNKCCRAEDAGSFQYPNILQLTTTCSSLMAKLFNQKKPVIFNPSLIAERQLYVQPHDIPYIFQFPDKFLFTRQTLKHAFSYFLLQRAFTIDLPKIELPTETLCETSATGDDQLAGACVAASFQSQIKAIVVCSAWPDTAINLTHFRPEVPVILVSPNKSFGDYILLYHHLVFMHFQARDGSSYAEYVTNAFIFAFIYLKSENILCDGQSIMLVYATNTAVQFCDNYFTFKFDENNFAHNLKDILFA